MIIFFKYFSNIFSLAYFIFMYIYICWREIVGFFNAVGQVITNQKTFKQWEREEADKQKQRQALAQKGISQAELSKATSKGKVIMDVIDIMDTHSEEVAENTETAIMPIAQSLPSLVSLLSMFGVTKFYTAPQGKAYDKAVNDFVFSKFKPETKFDIAKTSYTKNGEELYSLVNNLKEKVKNNPDSPLTKIKLAALDAPFSFGGKTLLENKHFDAYTLTSILNKKNMSELSKSNDSEVQSIYKRLSEISKEFNNTKGIKNNGFGKIMGKSIGIMMAISTVAFVAANIIAAKIQVKSSRIARWQSRQDLSDPKYFVQYTDEQIKQAESNLEANKEEENKGFSLFKNKNAKNRFKYSDNNGFFKSLFATIKDGKNYDKWKKDYNLEDKKVKRNLTPDEIKEAEKEQEVIQRITKIINNKAEEYSENMETTAGVLIGGTPFLGLGIGALINTFMTKTGLGDKFSEKQFNKLLKSVTDENTKEELKKLYENIKPKTNSKENVGFVASFSDKMKNVKNIGAYFEKMSSAIENSSAKGKENGLSYIFNSLKNTFNIALTTKTARNTLIGFAGTLITGTVGSLIGLKLQKSAARAGRYKAKRELEQNKENFVGFTKEDFNSVNNIKAEKKSAMEKLGEYLTFMPRVLEDYFNYEKYKKEKADYDKKLLGELTKLEVSDKQMQEAKELQRKLFTTFESVDDKSQEYSEAIEAVSEMSQPILPYIGIIIASIPLIISGKKLAKGGGAQAAESITGFFAKHTRFLKGKTANKYANGVTENIKGIVAKQQPNDKIAKNPTIKLLESLFANDGGKKLPSEIQNALATAKGKNNELKAFLETLADSPELKKSLNQEELSKGIDDLVNMITSMTKKQGGNNVEMDKIADAIKQQIHLLVKDCTNISDVLKRLLANTDIPNVKISEITDNLNMLNALGIKGVEEFKNSLKSNNIPGVANAIVEGKIQSGEWKRLLGQIKEGLPNSPAKTMLDKLINSSISNEQALKIYQNIQTILKNTPKEELSKIINTALEEFGKNPAKFMQALENGELKNILITKGVAVAAVAAPVTWSAVTLVITFIVESIFASMQKQAGRLGVMKALEELEDTKFYADMEPKQKELQTNTANIQTPKQLQDVNMLFNSLKNK